MSDKQEKARAERPADFKQKRPEQLIEEWTALIDEVEETNRQVSH